MTTTPTLTGREYLRVSQDRSGTGRSPDQQHDENGRAFPGVLGGPYVEPGSASASRYTRKAREVFSGLLSDLEAGSFGADALVLWEPSRGSRKNSEWAALLELCRDQGIKIWVTTHDYLYDLSNHRDMEALQREGISAESESAKTSARVRRNTAANAASGKPHGRVLFGYRREYDPATRAFLSQVEDTPKAEIVREAARRIISGDSCYGVAQDFNTRGISIPHKPSNPRNFPEWNGAQIKRMVTNPGYIGKRVHRGEVVGDAVWPALIDDATFYTCVRVLNDPARKQTRDGAVKFLLTGIATCGKCGRVLKTGRQNNGGVYKTYVCKQWCTSRRCFYLDEFISSLAIERLSRPDLLAVLSQGSEDSDETLSAIAEKKLRLQEIETEISSGSQSIVILTRAADQILSDIEALERSLKRATLSPVVAEMMGPEARQKWEAADLPRRREVIRALFEEIRILPIPDADRGKRGFNDSLIDIRWIPGLENERGRKVTVPPSDPDMPEVARSQRLKRHADDAPKVSREQVEKIKRALNS